MSGSASIEDRQEAAALKAEGAADILRRFSNEPVGIEIPTESGPLPSLKEWLRRTFSSIKDFPTATLPLTGEEKIEVLQGEESRSVSVSNLLAGFNDDLSNGVAVEKGAALIGRNGQVVKSVSGLRGLLKTNPSAHAFVTGYYAQGDGGGGAYFLDPDDTTSSDNGGTIIVAADGGRWKLKHSGFVTVRQFGAKGNGIDDDTTAIAAAYAAVPHIILRNGKFGVTTLDFSLNARRVEFFNAQIYGIATSPTDCVVRLRNSRHCRYDNIEIETHGNSPSPVYHPNYGCAMRWVSESSSTPVQFNVIDGLSIRYFKHGLVLGNFPGEAPQASAPQSENFVRGFKVRGVLCPIYSNAVNSYLTFTDHVIAPQQFEASASWFIPANGWCARCDEGSLMFIGGEFQRALSAGYSLYGKNIYVIGPIWEVGTRSYVTGDMSLSNVSNGSMGPGTEPIFEIAPTATGRLLLENFVNRRPAGTASSNRLDAFRLNGNNDYHIVFDNSRLFEWAWTAVNSNAQLASGGNVTFNGLVIDNSASDQPSYYFNEAGNVFTSADRTGQSMSAVADVSAKGGWSTAGTTGAFSKYTADVPPGETSAIRFTSSAATLLVTSPAGTAGSRITSGKDYVFEAWLKRTGPTAANTYISVVFYDFAGAALGSQTLLTTDGSRLDTNGFNNWKKFRAPLKPPSGAAYVAINVSVPATGADIALSGITIK